MNTDPDFKKHNIEDGHPVRTLLTGLERVQADSSFEARLQQRLANRQRTFRAFHLSAPAYAVSIAGAILIGVSTYSWLSPDDVISIQVNEVLVPEKPNRNQPLELPPPKAKTETRSGGEIPFIESPGRGPSDGQAEATRTHGVISNHKRDPASARLIDSLTYESSRIDSADSLQNQADSIKGDLE